MKYKYLFGPVPSRRLGVSLGVDTIPYKTCTLDCVYCECGRTSNLTAERKEYINVDLIITELKNYLSENPAPDFITFSGSGEPTLNNKIGRIIDFVKNNYPNTKIAVLTNGTLLSLEEVRKTLSKADVVLPSLDAAIQTDFQKINRPSSDIKLNTYIDGLIKFRKEYNGEIWLEIFFAKDINDNKENILALRDAINMIKPDKIQLNTLDRPAADKGITPLSKDELTQIMKTLESENIEIISKFKSRKEIRSFRKDVEDMIIETIKRRPCTLRDLSNILGLHINEINKYLDVLEKEGKIETTIQDRGVFIRLRKSL